MMDHHAGANAQLDRSLLIVGIGGTVHALERATGAIRWKHRMDGSHEVFIAVGYGVVVVSSDGISISCLDYLTGYEHWTRATKGGGRATILIEPEQIVCAKGGYIDCFAPNGAPLWAQPLPGAGLGKAALGYPGNVAQADGPRYG